MSPSLTILIPAYNEADTIGALIEIIHHIKPDAEILLVDDGSTDGTRQAAEVAGARVVRHPYNKGNGASIKTGLRVAQGDIVVIMDADGQHDPADIACLVENIGEYDLVVGARNPASQNSFVRGTLNAILNVLMSYISGFPIADATSGLRAFKRELALQFIHLFPNGFSTPVTMTLAFLKAGYSVKFMPIKMFMRSAGQSKINLFRDGTRFILIVLRMITIFSPLKVFFPTSVLLFAAGIVYGVLNAALIERRLHIAGAAALFVTMGVFVFLIGLVSEQIAALRFDLAGMWGEEKGRGREGRG